MELKEFISNTLCDIMDGIADAQSKVQYNNTKIIPDRGRVFIVEFEIELSELETKESGRGIGVALGNVGIGGNQKAAETGNSKTFVKFTVPVGYPERP